jgi:hypothetical protein
MRYLTLILPAFINLLEAFLVTIIHIEVASRSSHNWFMLRNEIPCVCLHNIFFKAVPLGSDDFTSIHEFFGNIPGNHFLIPLSVLSMLSL